MLSEARAAPKLAVAKVAFPRTTVPGPLADLVRDVRVTLPADEVLGEESVGVLGAHEAVQLVTAQMGRLGAGPALKMVRQPGGGGKSLATERAFNLSAAVDSGVEVLRKKVSTALSHSVIQAEAHHLDVVEVLKEAITRLAVVVRLDLMIFALLLGWIGLIATITLPSEVVLVGHVLPASALTAKV